MTEIQSYPAEPSLWKTIRQSLAGSHHGSYTDGSIDRAIVLLAIPMVLELVLESVFAVVDVFFVSRVGPDAVATVGLTEAMMTLIYAVAIGLGMGATATVARRMGERDPEGAAIAAVQAIALGLLVAVPVGLLGFWFARPILGLMGATPDVLAHSSFTAILFGFNGVILMLFLINAVFRGAGDAAIAMRVLWIANAFNIVLDPCLIFGLGPFPQLGVAGAAVATTTGRSIGVLVQLYYLSRSDGRIAIARRHLRLNPAVMLNMVRLSGSAVFQMFIGTTSYIGVMRIIASFGSVPVAACTIVVRIIMFVLMPSWGLSNAAATLVGQNLGAGQPERAETSAWRACWFNVAVLGVLGLLFVVFADVVVGWFTQDPEVKPIATQGLRIVSGGFPFYAAGYVLTQSFNGAGDTWTPTLINLGCFWFFEIPLSYVLGRTLGYGPAGIFWAMAIAFSVMSMVSASLFRLGHWKLKRV
ncbi:MAG TPA: MATE family efflux transporter [Vicinamibacterales bacterium]|nr:MATE family efflux transporter [Vicinamibacterales bacterium]